MTVVLIGLLFSSYMIVEWFGGRFPHEQRYHERVRENLEVNNIAPLDVGDAKIAVYGKTVYMAHKLSEAETKLYKWNNEKRKWEEIPHMEPKDNDIMRVKVEYGKLLYRYSDTEDWKLHESNKETK
jgi:hypothetical protein